MLWTEIAERIGMREEILGALRACAEAFDKDAYAKEIAALADPYRTAGAYQTLCERLSPDEENFRMELCQLLAAELMWDKYRALGIPEQIYWDTMGVFARCIEETKVYRGKWCVDRVFWTYRQVSMTIFRLGALEYELKRDTGKISIHIPSDADFSPASVDASLAQVRPFCRTYFPEFANADIQCGSWLLSDVLPRLLPENSNILRFQQRFVMTEQEHRSNGYIRFLFQMLPDTPTADLREDTSLQKKAKALLLSGGNIGTGSGILTVMKQA